MDSCSLQTEMQTFLRMILQSAAHKNGQKE